MIFGYGERKQYFEMLLFSVFNISICRLISIRGWRFLLVVSEIFVTFAIRKAHQKA